MNHSIYIKRRSNCQITITGVNKYAYLPHVVGELFAFRSLSLKFSEFLPDVPWHDHNNWPIGPLTFNILEINIESSDVQLVPVMVKIKFL